MGGKLPHSVYPMHAVREQYNIQLYTSQTRDRKLCHKQSLTIIVLYDKVPTIEQTHNVAHSIIHDL